MTSAADVSSQMTRALSELDYNIRQDLRLYDQAALRSVNIVGFASRIPSQKSACIAGHYCQASEAAKVLTPVSTVGVRYIYLAHERGTGRVYGVEQEPEGSQVLHRPLDEVSVDRIASYLLEHHQQFAPAQVIRDKYRGLPQDAQHPTPWQLTFAAAGLLDFQQEQTEESLVGLLHQCVADGRLRWARLGNVPDQVDASVGRAFLRMVAACALVHKGVSAADPADMGATLRAAEKVLPTFIGHDELGGVPSDVRTALWARLQEVRFELLTGDMLAGVYSRGLLDAAGQRQHGVYYTPPSVRRYLWNQVVPLLLERPQTERLVLDPTCGSGGFLLTAYDGLARLESVDLFGPHEVDSFRHRIAGVDQDGFACDIARLALILQSQPVTNRWRVVTSRFQDWTPAPNRRPLLVIGNPPFAGQQAVALFQRSLDWVMDDGIVALVMPRSFLSNVGSKQARRDVAERAELLCVHELPDGIFPHSQASTCVVVARRRRQMEHRDLGVFPYAAIDISMPAPVRRWRFTSTSQGFARATEYRPVVDFVDGAADLADVWRTAPSAEDLKSIAVIHEGVHLRARKGDPAVEVSATPKAGYLPFVKDAKNHIRPFVITRVHYLEWVRERMHRPRHLEWWTPAKVLLWHHVTHRQRWRLFGAVDEGGLAYGERVLGCYPKTSEWSPAALLALLSSNYANAWYASHSQQVDVLPEILYGMPVPRLRELELEHLDSLATALSACASDSSSGAPIMPSAASAYLMRVLLTAVDCVVCSAAELPAMAQAGLDRYLAEDGRARPGLESASEVPRPTLVALDGTGGSLESSSGIVLTLDEGADVAVLWLDGLRLRVPVCVPASALPATVRSAGRAILAETTVDAAQLGHVVVERIRSFPAGDLASDSLQARIRALTSV